MLGWQEAIMLIAPIPPEARRRKYPPNPPPNAKLRERGYAEKGLD